MVASQEPGLGVEPNLHVLGKPVLEISAQSTQRSQTAHYVTDHSQ